MSDDKTVFDCKIDSIISCANAFEQLAGQGAPEATPQDCAEQIRSRCGDLQIDTNELQAGADALAALDNVYFQAVAAILKS